MKHLLIILIALICLSSCTTGEGQTTWKPNSKYTTKDTAVAKKVHARCMGTTRKGERCKRIVAKEGDYCYQHQYQANK